MRGLSCTHPSIEVSAMWRLQTSSQGQTHHNTSHENTNTLSRPVFVDQGPSDTLSGNNSTSISPCQPKFPLGSCIHICKIEWASLNTIHDLFQQNTFKCKDILIVKTLPAFNSTCIIVIQYVYSTCEIWQRKQYCLQEAVSKYKHITLSKSGDGLPSTVYFLIFQRALKMGESPVFPYLGACPLVL
jgi:hypothetical protein